MQISTLGERQRMEIDDPSKVEGHRCDDAVPLVGDSLDEVVRWRKGAVIQPIEGKRIIAHLSVERAKIYAYELRAAKR